MLLSGTISEIRAAGVVGLEREIAILTQESGEMAGTGQVVDIGRRFL